MAFDQIITIGLNPTVDRVIEAANLRVGEHVQGRIRSVNAAGKAFNVSRVLGSLAVANHAMGFMGRDAVELFQLAARMHRIETEWTLISGRTRENLTLVDPIGGTATHIRNIGPVIEPAEWGELRSQLEAAARSGVLMIFCGSLPPGVRADVFGELLAMCTHRGAALAVDSSGPALKRAASQRTWLIKPNREELSEWVGRELVDLTQVIEAAGSLLKQAAVALISLGRDGCLLLTSRASWHAKVDVAPEMIRSTVGCGDALLGAFLAAYQRGESLEGCLAQAVATAAASAMSDLPASFAERDRAALLSQVVLSRL